MNKMCQPEQFQGRIIFMSMFNEDNKKECIANYTLVSWFAKRFPAGHWSFFGPGSETKWYSTYTDRPPGDWDKVAELMMIKFEESGHPVFRATSPLSRGTLKSKGGGKLSMHFCQYLRSSLRFVWGIQYLSNKYGETRIGRAMWPIVRASNLIDNDTWTVDWDSYTRKFLFQKYKERVESLPQPDRLIKICFDAGFLKTVEVGQYFMTKHTDEFLQFAEPVTCREKPLQRDENSTDPKGWIRGKTKMDPCWKSQPVTYKVNTEWKSELNLWKRQFSLVGLNFSWIEQVGHGLDRPRIRRQRAGNFWNGDGSVCG